MEGTDVADAEGRKDVSDLRSAKDESDFEESSEVRRTDGQEPQGTDGTVADTRSPWERKDGSGKEGEVRILKENVNRHDATWTQSDGTAPDDHKDGVQSEGDQAPGGRPQLHGAVDNNGSRVVQIISQRN